MTLAVNDAGDILTDAGGAWKPATQAINDKTGEKLVMDGGAWKPIPDSAADADQYGNPSASALSKIMSQASEGPQTQVGAYVNALGQGAVSGTGAALAGVGRQWSAAAAQGTEGQLAAMDAFDQGKEVPQDQDPIGYQFMSPDQRAKFRADLTAANAETSKREPNALTRAGTATEDGAASLFPVDPQLEGRGTSVGRMVGGIIPAMAASAAGSAVGGPVGAVLAGSAVIGSQTYDGVFRDAIANGASPQQAEDDASKSAALQMVAMSVPISKIMPLIPISLREGFLKTVANVGANYIQRGGEMSAGNTLATIAQNYVASQTYDPDRPVFQGTGDASIDGFLAGLVVHGATTAGSAAVRGIRQGLAPLDDVMAATDVDGAIAAAAKTAQGTDTLPAPPTMGEIFGPQSAGAAASRDFTTPDALVETPAQRATALQKMVNQSAEDRLTPQGRDDYVYVPGVDRPEAMRDFAPGADGVASNALAHKTFYNTDSNYHDQFDAQVRKNNGVMVERLNELFGDANSRDAAMNEAKELMPGSIGLFNDQKPVDAQPIVDVIKDILASPAGKRGAVESLLNNLLPKLYDANGNLETLPSMLKGVRDDITDKLYDKSPTTEGNAARTANGQLREVLSTIDDTIAEGLPGTKYQDYLSNLSDALGQVSKQDYLQKFLTGPRKLTDLTGNLQFNKVQKLLDDIQAHNADKTGGAKELTMEEINQIEAVRNELAAKDLLDRRAAVRGSPTAQITNASGLLGSGPLGTAVKGGAELAAHAALGLATHGVGNAVLGAWRLGVKPAMDAAKARQAADAMAETKSRLLDTTPQNPE